MADTIQQVLDDLTSVIDECSSSKSQIGFFAALYRRVTFRVQQGIMANRFADGPRMEKLDVIFARRFLDAYKGFRGGQTDYCICWQKAFKIAESSNPLILQQLLIGMNVHINLDLGLAAASISTPSTIDNLRADFELINTLLAEEMPLVRSEIDSMSPLIGWLDNVGGETDTAVINFSMEVARAEAWNFAKQTCGLEATQLESVTALKRKFVNQLSDDVAAPGGWLGFCLFVIRLFETKDTSLVIAKLRE